MNNAEDLVGNTPLVEVPYRDNLLYLKLEAANPGLSVKDRVAFHICRTLDAQIGLRARRVVEYSSGNLAIGLAMASKIYGFQLTLIVTSKTSPDKIKLLQRYGAELIMVDESIHSEDPLGFRGFAVMISQVRECIFIDQFNNPLNPEAHKLTTATEIHRAVPQADYVFSAMGTGGTASGIARYFKDADLPTQVVGITPDSGIYYTHFHHLEEKRGLVRTAIEGVGEDFLPGSLDMDILANVIEVRDAVALAEVETLITERGIYVGGSSGLAIAGAKQFLDENDLHHKRAVVICADSGNRYLSAFSPPQGGQNPRSVYMEVVEAYKKGDLPRIV